MDKKNVKIVATIGPASHTERMIYELATAGVDIFRINLSHAKPHEVVERTAWIRNASKKLGKELLILGDLPGPKIRIGDVLPNTYLEHGQKFVISKNFIKGDRYGCGVNYPEILDPIEVGAEVFIDDGKIKLRVENKTDEGIETVVEVGGQLRPKKGFSGEGIALNTNKVSQKDKDGIQITLEQGVDLLGVSFVETEDDIQNVKKLIPQDSNIKIIAKIETRNGVKNSESILNHSDGLMIARGDLGLAIPLATVPKIQKDLIKLCNSKRKISITATHMLESMISRAIPTRAEVSDVYNAVLDGTGAVMLSGETAEGKFPVETVEMMREIIEEAQKSLKG